MRCAEGHDHIAEWARANVVPRIGTVVAVKPVALRARALCIRAFSRYAYTSYKKKGFTCITPGEGLCGRVKNRGAKEEGAMYYKPVNHKHGGG